MSGERFERTHDPLPHMVYTSGVNPERLLGVPNKAEAMCIDVMLTALKQDSRFQEHFNTNGVTLGNETRLKPSYRHSADFGRDVLYGVGDKESLLIAVILNTDLTEEGDEMIKSWAQRIMEYSLDMPDHGARDSLKKFVKSVPEFEYDDSKPLPSGDMRMRQPVLAASAGAL